MANNISTQFVCKTCNFIVFLSGFAYTMYNDRFSIWNSAEKWTIPAWIPGNHIFNHLSFGRLASKIQSQIFNQVLRIEHAFNTKNYKFFDEFEFRKKRNNTIYFVFEISNMQKIQFKAEKLKFVSLGHLNILPPTKKIWHT